MTFKTLISGVLLLLVGCGSGGGDSPATPAPVLPAPSALTYPAAPTLVVAHAMAPLTPTVTGTVSSYSVAPALPAGLALNVTTGVISGTPTTPTGTATYVVTASNAGGSTTANVALTVQSDAKPAITYATPQVFGTGIAKSVTVVNTGGAVVTWSVSPALPAGLSLSSTDGSISGSPTGTAAAADYVITASNSGGSSTATVNLSVETPELVDLGHTQPIEEMRATATRLVSHDVRGHWVLWDAQTGKSLAKGDACITSSCPDHLIADIVGNLLVVRTPTTLEFRAAADGHSTGVAAANIWWWRIATDGSYVAGGGPSGLTIWGPTGTVLYTHIGDYSNARVFGAPGVLRVANSADSGNTLESIAVPSGVVTASTTFQGQVANWLEDGEAFISALGSTTWIYSKTGQQLELFSGCCISGGMGNRLWSLTALNLSFSTIGSGGATTSSFPVGQGSRIIVSPTANSITVLSAVQNVISSFDLTTPVPVRTDRLMPRSAATAYAAASTSSWWIGTQNGSIVDGASLGSTPQFLALGRPLSVAAGGNRVAVALDFGDILYFDATTKALQGRIPFQSGQLAMSADGSTLAAIAATDDDTLTDRSIKVFDLASGATKFTWSYVAGGPSVPVYVALSSNGSVLGRMLSTALVETARLSDGATLQTAMANGGTGVSTMALSPDGSTMAIAAGFVSGQIYRNGSLLGACAGYPVGWLDSNRLLVSRQSGHHTLPAVVDALGVDVSSLPQSTLQDVTAIQALDTSRFFVPATNQVYSSTTGLPLSGAPPVVPIERTGGVASNRVFYVSRGAVRADPL